VSGRGGVGVRKFGKSAHGRELSALGGWNRIGGLGLRARVTVATCNCARLIGFPNLVSEYAWHWISFSSKGRGDSELPAQARGGRRDRGARGRETARGESKRKGTQGALKTRAELLAVDAFDSPRTVKRRNVIVPALRAARATVLHREEAARGLAQHISHRVRALPAR